MGRFGIIEAKLFHPKLYLDAQIKPDIEENKLSSEKVWTYLVALKYANNQKILSNMLSKRHENLPSESKVWLEAYLYPTRMRKQERKCWKVRSDLCVGHLEIVSNRNAQLKSNGDWICIAEAKWFDDIHPNKRYPNIFQFSQIIEHAILMHNSLGQFPKRVYVTLITPKYFRDRVGKFSKRMYYEKYTRYNLDKESLVDDLKLCPLEFLHYDKETLFKRLNALILNWVTFEELLGLENLVSDNIPGKYRINRESWEQIFEEIGELRMYEKIVENEL